MHYSSNTRRICSWIALTVLCVVSHSLLSAQNSAAQSSEKPATKEIQSPEVDREALRKEAKKRREAERRFDETNGPTNPFIRQDFPQEF